MGLASVAECPPRGVLCRWIARSFLESQSHGKCPNHCMALCVRQGYRNLAFFIPFLLDLWCTTPKLHSCTLSFGADKICIHTKPPFFAAPFISYYDPLTLTLPISVHGQQQHPPLNSNSNPCFPRRFVCTTLSPSEKILAVHHGPRKDLWNMHL